jgi:hypothetical protein
MAEWSDDELANRRHEIRLKISEILREEELLKAERGLIDAEFFARLEARGATSTGTSDFTISMRKEPQYPMVTNRVAYENYILTNKALYLLQFRPSISALAELIAEGEYIPGVELVERTTINQTRKPTKNKKEEE